MYDPVTGARQSRIQVEAVVNADWNGQVDIQGFILNDNTTVKPWEATRKYTKGEIVYYKNQYLELNNKYMIYNYQKYKIFHAINQVI